MKVESAAVFAVVHGRSRCAPCHRGERETTRKMEVQPLSSSFTTELASPSFMAKLTELFSLPCSQPPSSGFAWLRNTNKKEKRRAHPLLTHNRSIFDRRRLHCCHRNLPLVR
ncbi:hypothetical protein PIB30_094989, partial [Stylosanthes scabra]|nr:hypothetical protein [Stylosanthes scabra]